MFALTNPTWNAENIADFKNCDAKEVFKNDERFLLNTMPLEVRTLKTEFLSHKTTLISNQTWLILNSNLGLATCHSRN